MKKKLAIITMLTFIFMSSMNQLIFAKDNTNALTLNKTNVGMIVGNTFDLNVKNKVSKSTYTWKSSNQKIVSVNVKNGKIRAEKVGKATITCTIKTKQNKKMTLKSAIVVKEQPEFFQYKIMAHALGGLENTYTYSNTLEGLQQSLALGYKFIEVDLILTADNKLVCSHGWSEQTYKDTGVRYDRNNPVMTYEQFMNTKIQGKYTTIDATKIVEMMKKNQDIYVEIDLRTLDKATATKTAQAIVEVFHYDRVLLDRLLVQVGSSEMYEAIDRVYHFKYYQYFVHKAEVKNIDKIISFCESKGIVSVAIKDKYLNAMLISKFKDHGLFILVHTVDTVEEAVMWLTSGVDIICTNFITYEDINRNGSDV